MRTEGLERVRTGHLDHDVWLRRGTSDPVVWGEVFTGRYHVPPASMPTPATVLDLGSNIGLTLADYRHRWPEANVVGVEMDAENADLARRNAPGARVLHAAVAAEAGTRTYAEGVSFALRLAEDVAEVEVEARTLDEIILTEFGEAVDFVKMDVEWTEWEIFGVVDRWRPLVRHLLVELHSHDQPDVRVGLAIDALWAAGYRAERHEAHPASVWAVA